MDVSNTDSDSSITWEDFFGSTTDLAPTLLGIYDSFLIPTDHQSITKDLTGKGTVGNPSALYALKRDIKVNVIDKAVTGIDKAANRTVKKVNVNAGAEVNNDERIVVNKSVLYSSIKTDRKEQSVENCNTLHDVNITKFSIDLKYKENGDRFTGNSSVLYKMMDKMKQSEAVNNETCSDEVSESDSSLKKVASRSEGLIKCNFDNLSPNVKRMVKTADVDASYLKLDHTKSARRPVKSRKQSNIPLVGATSKLTQSNIDLVDSTPIIITTDPSQRNELPEKHTENVDEEIYDVPKPIYDTVPSRKLDNLTLPYIDQAVEMNSTNGDREFNTKLSPRESTEAKLSLLHPGEVHRPLSLSSIASSSSNSSSGPTRAGVNSAYLASIESLDDHSDADCSKDFKEIRHEDSTGPTQLELVCEEIVHTENVYVEDLRQVVVGYLHGWREEGAFNEDELDGLFANIEDIYAFNKNLCAKLNACNLDALLIAQCFASEAKGFDIYTLYCTSYPATMDRLASLAGSKRAHRLKATQLGLGHPLPLNSYLLKPVQRILKYHLLLQNLVKHCACEETQYALSEMTTIARNINEMKKKHEHAVRVQEIQSLLYGWTGPDLTTYGELCAEGTFKVFGAKKARHLFLFDKMLLITKSKENGILVYKSHIMCNNLMLFESIEGAPLTFQVIPYDNPRGQITLLARNHTNKRDWTLLIKRMMLESHHTAIPERAVQLVMGLGQNKTDDDILAEKSNQRNNTINASIRKQMSAPIYLENRKMARKNFQKYKNAKLEEEEEDPCDCDEICEYCHQDMNFIDSTDSLRHKNDDLNSSQESVHTNRFNSRDFHSADNLADVQCSKIKENIVSDDLDARLSREKSGKTNEGGRSRSKDDPNRSRLSKIGNWRRKSEPGFQQNDNLSEMLNKHTENTANINFECKNCGSSKIGRYIKAGSLNRLKQAPKFSKKYNTLDIKMYNSKHVPKRVAKLRRNKVKSSKNESKFYTDVVDFTSDNVLHISESNESLSKIDNGQKDLDYKKLIERTDSFKKNELEKEKYINKETDNVKDNESSEEIEKPLEQIISQLLMQNKEIQKILQKQQLSSQKRRGRLQKIHSNPEEVIAQDAKFKPQITRQFSENFETDSHKSLKEESINDAVSIDSLNTESCSRAPQTSGEEHIYETLRVDTDLKTGKKERNESDYVYLAFDKVEKDIEEVIYDVPSTVRYAIVKEAEPSVIPIEIKSNIKSVSPDIWLLKQRELFITPNEKVPCSLPRSINGDNVTDLSDKSYKTKDGKNIRNGRPFTITSGKSEINYEDFLNRSDNSENDISQSTLELEKVLDKCFKSQFDNVIQDNIETFTAIGTDIDTSLNSSSEVLAAEKTADFLHPEHKIYKSSTNGLSLKNVFNRFRTKNSRKNSIDSDNEVSIDEVDKKAVLNPRNYSKTLLKRFKNIITDENDSKLKIFVSPEENSEIESSKILSKSFCVDFDKSIYEEIGTKSCEDLKPNRPKYDKSISVNSSLKSYSGVNRLPIYKQGSKDLGSRLAQSEYIDPKTIIGQKDAKNVNVLINKAAVSSEHLFSNSNRSIGINDFYEKSFEKIENYIDDDNISKETYSEHAVEKSTEENCEVNVREIITAISSKIQVTNEDEPKKLYEKSSQHMKTDTKTNKNSNDIENLSFEAENKPKFYSQPSNLSSKLSVATQSCKITKPAISEKPKVQPKPFPTSFLLVNPNYKSNFVKREYVASKDLKQIEPKVNIAKVENKTEGHKSNKSLDKKNNKIESSNVRKRNNVTNIVRKIDPKKEINKPQNAPTKIMNGNSEKVVDDLRRSGDKVELRVKTPDEILNESSLNIQLKRQTFERSSLNIENTKTKNSEIPKLVSKSIQERRKELETLNISSRSFRTTNRTEPIGTKVNESTETGGNSSSWVKQVVNKFQ